MSVFTKRVQITDSSLERDRVLLVSTLGMFSFVRPLMARIPMKVSNTYVKTEVYLVDTIRNAEEMRLSYLIDETSQRL
jgi:hypothetical protein